MTLETEEIVDKICEERFHKINDKRVSVTRLEVYLVTDTERWGGGIALPKCDVTESG